MGESDRVLTVLTREFGLIRAVAPGVRKQRSTIGGRSELFVVNELLIAKGRSLDKITQADTVQSHPGLSATSGNSQRRKIPPIGDRKCPFRRTPRRSLLVAGRTFEPFGAFVRSHRNPIRRRACRPPHPRHFSPASLSLPRAPSPSLLRHQTPAHPKFHRSELANRV